MDNLNNNFANYYNSVDYQKYNTKKAIQKRGTGIGLAILGMQVFSVILTLILSIFGFITGNLTLGNDSLMTNDTLLYYFNYGLLYLGMVILPFLILALCFKMKPNDIFFQNSFNKDEVGYSRAKLMVAFILVGFSLGMLLNFPIGSYMQSLDLIGITEADIPFTNPNNLFTTIIYCVIFSVLPALAEEFAFRGVVFGLLKPFGMNFAIFGSAMLFGIMHGTFSQIPFAFLVGLFMAYAMVKTKTIWTCVILHFLNNFVASILTIVDLNCTYEFSQIISYATFFVMFVLFIIGITLMAKTDKNIFSLARTKEEMTLTEKQKVSSLFGNAGMIIGLVAIGFLMIVTLFIS